MAEKKAIWIALKSIVDSPTARTDARAWVDYFENLKTASENLKKTSKS